jgi:hypothetical protein
MDPAAVSTVFAGEGIVKSIYMIRLEICGHIYNINKNIDKYN